MTREQAMEKARSIVDAINKKDAGCNCTAYHSDEDFADIVEEEINDNINLIANALEDASTQSSVGVSDEEIEKYWKPIKDPSGKFADAYPLRPVMEVIKWYRERARIVLPKRKYGADNLNDKAWGFEQGWNFCLDALIKLNPNIPVGNNSDE